ncbi:MAG: hypothetical protein ACI9LY_003967 [Arenicella sp.]|jgi:integrase
MLLCLLGRATNRKAMPEFLKISMNRIGSTVHGFSSTFRDWAAEVSNCPREIAEAALSHVISDKTETAYQRGDLLEKRRLIMQGWSDYIGIVGVNMVNIKDAR